MTDFIERKLEIMKDNFISALRDEKDAYVNLREAKRKRSNAEYQLRAMQEMDRERKLQEDEEKEANISRALATDPITEELRRREEIARNDVKRRAEITRVQQALDAKWGFIEMITPLDVDRKGESLDG